VADVVPAVPQRRPVEGQQPDAVDAQPAQVLELGHDPGQVAGAVVVGVVEAARDDLVEHRPLVPTRVVGQAGPSLAARARATAPARWAPRRLRTWSAWAGA